MIEIKPAEIVGASIADRVSWETDTSTWYGHINGLSADYPGRIIVEITHRDSEPDTGLRHIEPSRLSLAPKRYAVGDKVRARDAECAGDGHD